MIRMSVPLTPASKDTQVNLSMSLDDAVRLFHDLNRLMAVLDEAAGLAGKEAFMSPEDRAAYERTSNLICMLESKLQIEPEKEPR